MVDATKYASKRFIKFEDVQAQPRRETIVDVGEGQYGKLVLTLASGRRFSLNGTNVGIMMEHFGEETEHWRGIEIELYRSETKYMGEPRETVLIRPIPPSLAPVRRSKPVLVPQPKPEPKPEANEPPADEMNDQIPF